MSQTSGACDLLRGVGRALADAGQTVLAELPLGNGRRADLAAIDRAGAIILVEVKSCRADFRADRKWREYLDYCDRFYFAVALRGEFCDPRSLNELVLIPHCLNQRLPPDCHHLRADTMSRERARLRPRAAFATIRPSFPC
jgi:hypothetical protein